MTRPPEHPPLRHPMADNRDKTPYATVPCPILPDRAYKTGDPVGEALLRPDWPGLFPATGTTDDTEVLDGEIMP